MVANAIAYFLAALFFAIGVFGLYRIGNDEEPKGKTGLYITVSFLFIFAAWGCAKLGGI